MKRAGIVALAIVLSLGLGVSMSHAAKRVKSEVDIDGFNYPPPDYPFQFVGSVYSKKAKCVPKREVSLFYVEGGLHTLIDTAKTDDTGDWVVDRDDLKIAGGDYQAEVEKRKIKKGDKKIVCKADVSPTFVLAVA